MRVFSIDKKTSLLTERDPYAVPAGSGPRHGTFLKTRSGKTFFFLISELANTIASYEVTYCDSGMNLTNVFNSGTYGDQPTPEGAAAAEVLLSVRLLPIPRLIALTYSSPTDDSFLPHLAMLHSSHYPISTQITALRSRLIHFNLGPSTSRRANLHFSSLHQQEAAFQDSFH